MSTDDEERPAVAINEKRLRFAREQARVTQRQVARILGVSASLISNMENGRVAPNAEDLDRLSRFYSRKISWLAESAEPDENEEPPSPDGAILDVVSIYSDKPKALERVLHRLRVACAEEED